MLNFSVIVKTNKMRRSHKDDCDNNMMNRDGLLDESGPFKQTAF